MTNWWGSYQLISPFHFSAMSLPGIFLEACGEQRMMSLVRETNAEKAGQRIKKGHFYGAGGGEWKQRQRQRQMPFMQFLLLRFPQSFTLLKS